MSWELPFLLWGCFIFFHRKDTLLASLRLLVLFLSPFTWAMFSLEFFKPCSSVFCFRRQCTQDGSLLWKTHRSPLCCCTAEKENVLSSACPSQSFKTNHALHNHLPNTSSNTVKEVKEEQGKNKVCSTLNQPSFAQPRSNTLALHPDESFHTALFICVQLWFSCAAPATGAKVKARSCF